MKRMNNEYDLPSISSGEFGIMSVKHIYSQSEPFLLELSHIAAEKNNKTQNGLQIP